METTPPAFYFLTNSRLMDLRTLESLDGSVRPLPWDGTHPVDRGREQEAQPTSFLEKC